MTGDRAGAYQSEGSGYADILKPLQKTAEYELADSRPFGAFEQRNSVAIDGFGSDLVDGLVPHVGRDRIAPSAGRSYLRD